MNRLLNGLGIIIERDIKQRIRSGQVRPASKSSGTTLVKSAKLVNSITHKVVGDRVLIGSNLRYARIHHEGGIIRPVNAKYLAIPLTKEASVKRPREFTDTFIAKSIIFRKGADGKPEALYALKPQVVMPARPYMFITGPTLDAMRALVVNYIETQRSK